MQNQHSDTAITKIKESKTRKCIPKNKQMWGKSGDFLGAELLGLFFFFPKLFKMTPGPQTKGAPVWSQSEIKKCRQQISK